MIFVFDLLTKMATMPIYGKTKCLKNKSKKEGKDQESIQSNTTPEPGHHKGNLQNTIKHHIQENQEVSLS